MMRGLLPILLAGLSLAGTPTLRRVQVEGNRFFSRREILEGLSLFQGKPLPGGWPSESLRALAGRYHREGFFFFRVDSFRMDWSADSAWVDVALWIHEGKPARLGRLRLEGIDPIGKGKVLSSWRTETGGLFREQLLRDDITGTLDRFAETGYPLAKVSVDSLLLFTEDPPLLDVVVSVHPGPLVRYGRITFRGNTVTRTRLVMFESRLKPGDPFALSRIRAARVALLRSGLFEAVEEPEIRFREGRADLFFTVKEGSPNRVEGVVGYQPSPSPHRRGYFTGTLNFDFRNLWGTGRALSVYWAKKDARSQAMRVGYEEPWLFGNPLFVGGGFSQEIRDTTYLEREWRLSLRYVPRASVSMGMEFGRRTILPDSMGRWIWAIPRSQAFEGTLRFAYDAFDDPLNPTKGMRYHTSFTVGGKRVLDSSTHDTNPPKTEKTQRIALDWEAVYILAPRRVLFVGAHGVQIDGGRRPLPLPEQVRFGGATTLRGYPEDAFRGSLVAWFNLEYRYLVGRRSRFFWFIDGGIYQREEALGLVRGWKWGKGFGLRIETRLGLVGVDYGWGEGDGFLRGKVHVRMAGRF